MILAELDTTLLAIVGTMIGAGVVVLKWLMSRTDKMWDWIKHEEETVHTKILETLAVITQTQLEIIRILKDHEKAA
jgi:hypothetical protein